MLTLSERWLMLVTSKLFYACVCICVLLTQICNNSIVNTWIINSLCLSVCLNFCLSFRSPTLQCFLFFFTRQLLLLQHRGLLEFFSPLKNWPLMHEAQEESFWLCSGFIHVSLIDQVNANGFVPHFCFHHTKWTRLLLYLLASWLYYLYNSFGFVFILLLAEVQSWIDSGLTCLEYSSDTLKHTPPQRWHFRPWIHTFVFCLVLSVLLNIHITHTLIAPQINAVSRSK